MKKYIKVSSFLFIFLSAVLSQAERNPFSYGPACTQTPYCEVLAFGHINALPVAVASVNGVVQTLKIGDRVGTSTITAFESEHIIMQDFKNTTQRTIALKKCTEKKSPST